VRRARPVVAAALLVLTAACSTAAPPASSGPDVTTPPESRVDVDTAALRAAKKAAGVEPCRPPAASQPAATDPLPGVTLPCLGGGPDVRLDRLRGPLVINLFAQWCGPCRSEMPYYQQLHTKSAGTVQVLGIDYLDTQPAAALQLVRQTGVTYPLLADPSGALRTAFRIRGLPGVVLVDARGRVVDVEFRVVRSYEELRGLVQQRLGVRLPR
jgi:thiol-disulfide isomerase/thioredoxin